MVYSNFLNKPLFLGVLTDYMYYLNSVNFDSEKLSLETLWDHLKECRKYSSVQLLCPSGLSEAD